jgi:hypothetical protein
LLDCIPPILIIIIVFLDCIPGKKAPEHEPADDTLTPDEADDMVLDPEAVSEFFSMNTFLYALQSFACILMWLKFMYFLRIYRSTGFFVNMLLQMAGAVRTFSIVLLIILAAFGCTFKILGASPGGPALGFFEGIFYSYLLALGEFQMDDYADLSTTFLLYLFFIVASIILLIVMLNILIALISSVYEQIIEEQEPANDYERIALISETLAMLKLKEDNELRREDEYLLVARRNQAQFATMPDKASQD